MKQAKVDETVSKHVDQAVKLLRSEIMEACESLMEGVRASTSADRTIMHETEKAVQALDQAINATLSRVEAIETRLDRLRAILCGEEISDPKLICTKCGHELAFHSGTGCQFSGCNCTTITL